MVDYIKSTVNTAITGKLTKIIAEKIFTKIKDKLPPGSNKIEIMDNIKATLEKNIKLDKKVTAILNQIENNSAVDLIALQADILGAIPIPEVGDIIDIGLQTGELALPQFLDGLKSSANMFSMYKSIEAIDINTLLPKQVLEKHDIQQHVNGGSKKSRTRRRRVKKSRTRRRVKKSRTRRGIKSRKTRRKY